MDGYQLTPEELPEKAAGIIAEQGIRTDENSFLCIFSIGCDTASSSELYVQIQNALDKAYSTSGTTTPGRNSANRSAPSVPKNWTKSSPPYPREYPNQSRLNTKKYRGKQTPAQPSTPLQEYFTSQVCRTHNHGRHTWLASSYLPLTIAKTTCRYPAAA